MAAAVTLEVADKKLKCGNKCSLPHCRRSKRDFPNMKLFKFPEIGSPLYGLWAEKCHFSEKFVENFPTLFLCDNHFSPNLIGNKFLKRGSVPNLCLKQESESVSEVNPATGDIDLQMHEFEVETHPYRIETFNITEDQHGSTTLKDLICVRFGFNEHIYKRVVENDFDVESLLVATESEINDLFPAPLLGTRAKFKFELHLWRNNIETDSSVREWIDLNSAPKNRPLLYDNQSPSSSIFHGVDSNEADMTNNFNLIDLLNQSENGVDVLRFYEKENCLDELNRDILINIIVNSFSNNKIEMSMKDIQTATNAILDIFPGENEKYYLFKRGSGLNSTGKLHDKAVNARIKLKKLRKRHCLEPVKELKTPGHTILSSDEKSIAWLRHNSEPWSEVVHHWTKVQRIRQRDMKTNGRNALKNWPLFKHSDGYKLVYVDYIATHTDNTSQLFQLWPTFCEKLLPYFRTHIKDRNSLDLLNILSNDTDTNSRDCIFALLLHAILKSVIISVENKDEEKAKWKPSIRDSQESCILHCTLHSSPYMEMVKAMTIKYHEKGLTMPPIIIVIGENIFTLKLFYTYYNDILYEFDSFLKCLDVTFKLFHVMNLEYPKASKNVYNLLENYFYNFNTVANSNVAGILDYLKK